MILADFPTWFLRTFAVTFGLVWGSFLNVVIWRLPRGMSVVSPPSHCPGCGKPIRAWDNVPVLGYLLLRGKARCCGVRMSPRYPAVEALGGLLSLAIVEVLLQQFSPSAPAALFAANYFAELAVGLGLLAAAFIDAEHMYLPDPITLGGTALGLGTATLRGLSFSDSAVGAALGFLMVWAPFVFAYARLRGRAGMGMGDAKLTMLAGAWFGWPGAVFVLFAGAVQGTLGALVILLVRGKIEEPEAVRADREELTRLAAEGDAEAKAALAADPLSGEPEAGIGKARMPFGPFLILAFFEVMLARDALERLGRKLF